MAQLKVYFFRHGLTYGNVEARMCGRTDTLVCKEGWDELYDLKEHYEYPEVEKVFASPAIRCRETASVLFPGQLPELIYNFWEMDFGTAEYAKVEDHKMIPDYQKWIRQDPDFSCLGGETILECKYRAVAAMTRVVKTCMEQGLSKVAVVAHGEILSCLLDMTLVTEEPKEAFMLCPNGMGYAVTIDTEKWFFEEQKMYFDGFMPVGAPRPKLEESPFFTPVEEAVSEDEKSAVSGEGEDEESTVSSEREEA